MRKYETYHFGIIHRAKDLHKHGYPYSEGNVCLTTDENNEIVSVVRLREGEKAGTIVIENEFIADDFKGDDKLSQAIAEFVGVRFLQEMVEEGHFDTIVAEKVVF